MYQIHEDVILHLFFFTSARSEININRRVARQEDNSIVITLTLVNMKKCWVVSFFFRVNFNLMHLKEFKQTKKKQGMVTTIVLYNWYKIS